MNLVQKSVEHGGKLAPLVISKGATSGTGLMNPSVFVAYNTWANEVGSPTIYNTRLDIPL